MLDLGFGACALQVQTAARGGVEDPRELVGRNVVTSFTGLTSEYFGRLEGKAKDAKGAWDLETKIKYVGGSVEAACALGVADAVVDLVGMWMVFSVIFFCCNPPDPPFFD